ncbi:MAG: transposase [Planctomycetota bacterium]|nr:transposase [Planctomycetota bacterium]
MRLHDRQAMRRMHFDYASRAAYFITICESKRRQVFSTIDEGLHLTPLGKIIEQEWLRTASLRSYVALGEFVIMPNHFHGILKIMRSVASNPRPRRFGEGRTASVASIVGNFKAAVTRRAQRELPGVDWGWQPRFYDHVIRDEHGYLRVEQYIQDNPHTWVSDRDNPQSTSDDRFHEWLESLPPPKPGDVIDPGNPM